MSPPIRTSTRTPTTPRWTNPPTCTCGWRPTAPPWPWSDDDDPPALPRTGAPCADDPRAGAARPARVRAAEACAGRRAARIDATRATRAARLGTTVERRSRNARRLAARPLEFRRRRQAPAHARPRARVAHDDAGTAPRRARRHGALVQPVTGTTRPCARPVPADAHHGSGPTPRPARAVAFDDARTTPGLARRAAGPAERATALSSACRALRPHGAREQLVVPVKGQRAVLHQQRGEVEDVARVHFARVQRAHAGEIQRAADHHAVDVDGLPALGEFAVAAGFRGEIHDDAARAHAGDHRGRKDLRRRPAGHGRGAHHHVDVLQVFGEAALLFGALLVGELARVTALARRAHAEVEELAAERFDLFARFRAHVEAFDLRTQALGGRDCLKSCDTGADDEHARRTDGARGGGQHREEARRELRGDQRRLVTGHAGLRAQHVHGLRTRGAR